MEDFRIYVGDIVYFGGSKNILCRISSNKCEIISMRNGKSIADVKFHNRNENKDLNDYTLPYINLSDINDKLDVRVTKVVRKGEIVYFDFN